ncbi:hypothetical protein ACMA1I_06170 [Pontibacter sp. 13R65]|uniref:hypothetical protein n=1 Tax=Pontibacter sp. 13R65 TaxID=3127458 RepID=UPI00301BFB5F
MRRKPSNIYFYLTAGVLLLFILPYYYLCNILTFKKQGTVQEVTQIGNTTFKLLDHELCSVQCSDALHCENLYLYSVHSANDKAVLKFLKEFKPVNGCYATILLQSGNTASKDWKAIVSAKPDEVNFPKTAFALNYKDKSSLSTLDLVNGKANGMFRKYNSDGSLFIEQRIVNNVADEKRIVYYLNYKVVQEWKDNRLISEDTIK